MAYTTIDDPTIYFNTKLYTGNGSTQSITGVGFQPDWLWIKNRDGTNNHILQDVVRGATKSLESDGTTTETTSSTRVTSFDSDGFSVGSAGTNNTNSNNYVSWNWKAGGSAVTNNDGDMTSSVSANNTAGFSIITWTGDGSGGNVGTGLSGSETIGFATVKKRSTTSEWQTGVSGAYSGLARNFAYHQELNSTSALSGSAPYMMTSMLSGNPNKLRLASEGYVNGVTYVAYVFKPVKGYSAMGAYTGSGNADGTFVYTGFRPAWVLIKRTDSTNNWSITDNKRTTFNVVDKQLQANTSDSEESVTICDFTSNGIKLRSSANQFNGSGASYIYMAFAEAPFVNSNGVPTNAR